MWEESKEKSTILPPLSLSVGEKSEGCLTSVGLVQKCQKAFRNTMNEKHFGCLVQFIDKKVTGKKNHLILIFHYCRSLCTLSFNNAFTFLQMGSNVAFKKCYSVHKNVHIN